ncbi:MAG: class I SAM-dependent methyltransferase [Bacteroidales bacterium]
MKRAPETVVQSRVVGYERETSPSPARFFETAFAYQRSAALKAAVELDLFTAIAEGATDVAAVASRAQASERGIRILCDYMVISGFLAKEDGRYALTHDSFMFLNRRSPAYVGDAVAFLTAPEQIEAFANLSEVVRRGSRDAKALEPDNPMWVTFARSMAGMARMTAGLLADFLGVSHAGAIRVLDVAAGHGFYGIAVAQQNPEARVVGLDWASVLEEARQNARAAGVEARYATTAGDAMSVELGGPYDLVLLPNFLHHFDERTCTAFLRRIREALKDGGRVAALEFVPDEDRVNPPMAAAFALTMLGLTPAGDAYTFEEYRRMFGEAGLTDMRLHDLPPAVQRVVTALRVP